MLLITLPYGALWMLFCRSSFIVEGLIVVGKKYYISECDNNLVRTESMQALPPFILRPWWFVWLVLHQHLYNHVTGFWKWKARKRKQRRTTKENIFLLIHELKSLASMLIWASLRRLGANFASSPLEVKNELTW